MSIFKKNDPCPEPVIPTPKQYVEVTQKGRAFRQLYTAGNGWEQRSMRAYDSTYKFCGTCGSPLKKIIDYRSAFSRETGERLWVRKIACSTDIKTGHDIYTDTTEYGFSLGITIETTEEPLAKAWRNEPL